MHLAPQNNACAIMLALGNKFVFNCIVLQCVSVAYIIQVFKFRSSLMSSVFHVRSRHIDSFTRAFK